MLIRFRYYKLLIGSLIIVISSCSSMYIPTMSNIPLLEKKGEGQIEVAASTNSAHLSGDYAFSERYALLVNGSLSYKNFTNNYDVFTHESHSSSGYFDFHGKYAHKYIELGLGRYNILKNEKKLEVFGIMGYGYASEFPYSTSYYSGFAQVNYGRSFGFTDIGWSTRIGPSYNIFMQDEYDNQTEAWSVKNTSLFFYRYELMTFVRFGFERLRFVYKFGISNCFIPKSTEDRINNERLDNENFYGTLFHISFGVNYKFNIHKND